MKQKILRVAIVSALFLCSFPHPSHAETFTSADFLEWKESSQDFYIEASIGMAAVIATQTDKTKKHAPCIDSWYYPNEKGKNDFIRKVMKENPEYHPRGIILGILEKQCGEF